MSVVVLKLILSPYVENKFPFQLTPYILKLHNFLFFSERELWQKDTEKIQELQDKLGEQKEQDAAKIQEYNVSHLNQFFTLPEHP